MTYKVQFEEHNVYVLTFDSKEEYERWDNLGGCLEDLHPDEIQTQKELIDCVPITV